VRANAKPQVLGTVLSHWIGFENVTNNKEDNHETGSFCLKLNIHKWFHGFWLDTV